MPKFELKNINNRLVIDLNKMKDDYSEAYGFDGKPSFYDVGELAATEAIGTIELSELELEVIMVAYSNGGKCDWCGDTASELSGPHLLDYVPGARMCKGCWEHDREMYLGSVGQDIGEFKQIVVEGSK